MRWRTCMLQVSAVQRVGGVVGYRICLTHRRSSVRTWADSLTVTWYVFEKNPPKHRIYSDSRKSPHREIIVHIILQLNNLGSMPKENWYNLRLLSKKREREVRKEEKKRENGSVQRTTQDSKRKHPQKFHKQTDRHKKNKDSKKVARGSKWAGEWIAGIDWQ